MPRLAGSMPGGIMDSTLTTSSAQKFSALGVLAGL
jgi:hypothetical protein